MLARGRPQLLSCCSIVANSGRAGALKLNPNRASMTKLNESVMSFDSEGRYERNGMSIFSH